jgi:hypothetical protein
MTPAKREFPAVFAARPRRRCTEGSVEDYDLKEFEMR